MPSIAVRKKLVKYAIVKFEKCNVIANGISSAKDFLIRNPTPPNKEYSIVIVANFYSSVKGHAVAIRALKYMPANYRFTFIGEGILLESIIELAAELGVEDRLEFMGGLSNTALRVELKNFDLMVVPSLSESFGMVAIEAMAAGLPVIASCVGGLPDVIGKANEDALFKPNNPRLLGECVVRICENSTRWLELHNLGIQRVKSEFSVQVMAEKYSEIFNEK